MTSTSKILIDARSGGNLLLLPLDKVMQMSGAGAPDALPGARAAETPAVPEAPARTRDALRSRDREGRP